MKSLALAALLLFHPSANAGTQLIIKSGGQSATVLMLAFTENPDATNFYELLTVGVHDHGSKESKQISFTDDRGVRAVEITCAFSKLSGRTGSCTAGFNMAQGMEIAPGRIQYSVSGSEAARLAALFKAGAGEIFRSTDSHLVLVSQKSNDGSVSKFEIRYF